MSPNFWDFWPLPLNFFLATTSESPSPMSTTIPNESTKSPSPTTTYSASTMTTQIPFEGKKWAKPFTSYVLAKCF